MEPLSYEEIARRRQEAIANPSADELEAISTWRRERQEAKAKAEADLASLDVTAELDSLAVEAKNKTADPPGMRSAVSSPQLGDEKIQLGITTSINDNCCQVQPSKKIVKWGVTLTDAPPSYWINRKVAESRGELNPNERHCLGLLNALMKNRFGNTFVTDEQLAHWLGLDHPGSAKRILQRLTAKGTIKEKDRVIKSENGHRLIEHRIVVCRPWRDPSKKTET